MNEKAGAAASNAMVLIEVVFEMVTEVGAPLFMNVAVPSGTVGVELQLVPVVHSLVVAPVQVPSTACPVPGPSIASAPMHTLPSSAARWDVVRAPSGAIRMARPIESPDSGRSAGCAVRECDGCERIHPDPCNGTAGKPRPCATPPPPPRLVWGQATRRIAPDQFRMGCLGAEDGCLLHSRHASRRSSRKGGATGSARGTHSEKS